MRERWLHLSFQIILHGRKRRSMRTSWSKHMQTLKTGNKNKIWIRNIVRQKTNRSSPGWPDCVSEKSRIRVYRTKNIDVTLISIEIFGGVNSALYGKMSFKIMHLSLFLPRSSVKLTSFYLWGTRGRNNCLQFEKPWKIHSKVHHGRILADPSKICKKPVGTCVVTTFGLIKNVGFIHHPHHG